MSARLPLLLVLPVLLCGCLEIHYHLKVDTDLSGTAEVRVIFEGQDDQPITEEAVDAYRTQNAEKVAKTKEEVKAGFPEGVELVHYDIEYVPDNKAAQVLVVGFDQVEGLSKVQEGRGQTGQPQLEGIEVERKEVDGFYEVTIRQRVTKNNANQQEDPLAEKMKDQMEGKTARYVYELPGEVVSHTAHEVDGNTLTWEWPMKALLYETEERTVEATFRVPMPSGDGDDNEGDQ